MFIKGILKFVFRLREKNSQRVDDHKKIQKGRRHSHVPNVKNSRDFTNPSRGTGAYADHFARVNKATKRERSIEEIEREYNQLGCQFYQIYHPSTGRNLQVYAGNNSIGSSEDTNNFSSKCLNK